MGGGEGEVARFEVQQSTVKLDPDGEPHGNVDPDGVFHRVIG